LTLQLQGVLIDKSGSLIHFSKGRLTVPFWIDFQKTSERGGSLPIQRKLLRFCGNFEGKLINFREKGGPLQSKKFVAKKAQHSFWTPTFSNLDDFSENFQTSSPAGVWEKNDALFFGRY